MKRIITILLAAIVIVAIGQDSPRPSLSALDNVRNLVASMRQESIAAMGLSRRERRRAHAENAYHKLKYRRPNCRPCPECGQPVLPDGQMRPHPDWYRHASGCPLDDWSPNAPGEPRRTDQ